MKTATPLHWKHKIAQTYALAQRELNSSSSKSRALQSFYHDIKGHTVHENTFVETGYIPLSQSHYASRGLTGLAPYWSVKDLHSSAVRVFFHPDDRFIHDAVLVVHLWDVAAQKKLLGLLGPATGFISQDVLVNLRTVSCHREDSEPVLIKLSTYQSDAHATLDVTTQKNIFLSNLEVSSLFIEEPFFLSERSGLWVESENFFLYQVYRPYPFHHMQLDGNDLYLPLFAVYSRQIQSTSLENHIFGATDKLIWFQDQLAQKLVALLLKSFFHYGIHFELHQQNLNVLIRHGQVTGLYLQDFFDVLEDPVAQSLLNWLPPEKIGSRKRALFGFCHESAFVDNDSSEGLATQTISSWYRLYLRDLGQHEKCINENFLSGHSGQNTFDLAAVFSSQLQQELNKFTKRFSLSFSLSEIWEHSVVVDPIADLYARLTALRELINLALLRQQSLGLAVATSSELLEFSSQAKRQGCVLNSYGSQPLPEVLSEALRDVDRSNNRKTHWNTWVISLPSGLKVLYQQNCQQPERARYYGVL